MYCKSNIKKRRGQKKGKSQLFLKKIDFFFDWGRIYNKKVWELSPAREKTPSARFTPTSASWLLAKTARRAVY
jgi:hypothetical protein